jgi:hypothetical protein
MNIKWKSGCDSEAIALISLIKEHPDNASPRWYPNLVDTQIALSAFLDFSSVEGKRTTLRLQIVEVALCKALKEPCVTPKEFLSYVNEAYREIYEKRDTQFHVIATLNVSEPSCLPFEALEYMNCKIEVLGRFLPLNYGERASKYTIYKEYDEPCFLKVVVYAKNSSEALRIAMKFLDYIRGLVNLFNNNSRAIIFTEPVLVNKIQFGYLITCHESSGLQVGAERYINPSSKFASPASIKDPERLKISFDLVHSGIVSLLDHSRLADVIVLFARALDEISAQSAFILAWTALENLVAPNKSNAAELIVGRISSIFDTHLQEKAILEGLRMARNELVHSASAENDYLNCVYAISYYFKTYLVFLARNIDRNYSEIIRLLDCPTDVEELKDVIKLYERALKFRKGS